MVVDVFTYNGEADILEIHLNILKDVVDQFIIVEAPTTFSGKPKPLYYREQKERYREFWDKIIYHIVDENYTDEEKRQAEESPNTVGASHWKREFLQKESIKKALTHLRDDDVVFIGDVDEIIAPEIAKGNGARDYPDQIFKPKMNMYTYYLNNRTSELWAGTIFSLYKNIKNACLNHIRSQTEPGMTGGSGYLHSYFGWHFSSMGGLEELRRKLSDSYTEESYWSKDVQDNLKTRLEQNKDFLGRGFNYWVDESGWPQYLKDNKEKYKHLCKP